MRKQSSFGILEPENEYYLLIQAHIYLYGEKKEEARWILENFNYNRFAIGKKPEISAYYLFLTALLREDTSHTNRVLEELNRLYIKYPYSWQLLCMLVNLDPKYKSDSERFRMLERQFYNGTNHVLILCRGISLPEKPSDSPQKTGRLLRYRC
mgnify:CR=1 FL=1